MEKLRYERPVIKKLESNLPNKFGTSSGATPKTHIDGVSVKQMIEEYGSPLFVISEETIRKPTEKLKKLLQHAILKCSLHGHIKPII